MSLIHKEDKAAKAELRWNNQKIEHNKKKFRIQFHLCHLQKYLDSPIFKNVGKNKNLKHQKDIQSKACDTKCSHDRNTKLVSQYSKYSNLAPKRRVWWVRIKAYRNKSGFQMLSDIPQTAISSNLEMISVIFLTGVSKFVLSYINVFFGSTGSADWQL